jgi:phosphatidylglycerophosphate synthase
MIGDTSPLVTGGSPSRRPTIGGVLIELRSAQKPGTGVPAYTRWLNRRAARLAAAVAVRMGYSPNTVSAISAAFSIVAIVVLLLSPVSVVTGLVVAGLLAVGYCLDSADGQVARVTGTGSPAGEWLDHVIDAARTPAIHLAVYLALSSAALVPAWVPYVALGFVVLSASQFMSQILAEQLRKSAVNSVQQTKAVAAERGAKDVLRSVVLLPTDSGTLCWIFILWGFPHVFAFGYVALCIINSFVAALSMRRKYLALSR